MRFDCSVIRAGCNDIDMYSENKDWSSVLECINDIETELESFKQILNNEEKK
jgi:hypothetical protein